MAARVVRVSIGSSEEEGGVADVYLVSDDERYDVAVHLRHDVAPETVSVAGISVRRREGSFGLKQLRTLDLGNHIRAARAATRHLLAGGDVSKIGGEAAREAEARFLQQRGRPARRRSVEWHRTMSDDYKTFERAGRNPVREIAKRESVDENLVHQWVYQWRHKYGLLPKPSRRGKR